MTINEAIKYLINIEEAYCSHGSIRQANAVKLGIEALKRQERWRRKGLLASKELLPSETK